MANGTFTAGFGDITVVTMVYGYGTLIAGFGDITVVAMVYG
jgi:hypothetical protein